MWLWLHKPVEDVAKQLYVPSNPKYFQLFDFVSLNMDGQNSNNP
jgi:hypothetical protein